MPNRASWNGRWSGDESLFAIIKNMPNDKAIKVLEKKYHHYSFGDGWSAGVDIKHVDAKSAAKIRNKSKGFCGYDWMVNEIISHGEILGSRRKSEQAA